MKVMLFNYTGNKLRLIEAEEIIIKHKEYDERVLETHEWENGQYNLSIHSLQGIYKIEVVL